METNTSKFLKVFDPSDQKHVNLNPMRIELDHRDTLDWFHIHFVLCGKYAKAVLNGTAWIPTTSS